jgi:hypothetical protein
MEKSSVFKHWNPKIDYALENQVDIKYALFPSILSLYFILIALNLPKYHNQKINILNIDNIFSLYLK